MKVQFLKCLILFKEEEKKPLVIFFSKFLYIVASHFFS